MSIWDAIGNGLEFGKTEDNKGKPLLATTFTANFGDTINTLMGGGRFTNLIGSDAKVVFDWQELFGLENKWWTAFQGLGGDALMVYGNKTAFHYSGIAFTSRRGEKPPINFSDTATMNLEAAAKRKGVFITVGVGIAAIVALSVTVRVKYSNFPMNKEKTELEEPDDELAKNLICGFFVICEDRWLLFLRYLDIGFQMETLFGKDLIAAQDELAKARKNLKIAECVCKFLRTKQSFTHYESAFAACGIARAAWSEKYSKETSNLKCYLD